ncbi:arylsulfatase [Novosphingobium sp. YJ-S2-02]|uniref:Arylsulfatase n=1 Tax=Novosphingobium aureum TaxID=2792964 RepID=A0A931HGC8_9SPHN|nr:arylsulfatase [Novosphingobium aureum]MBH0114831.1 arylsulfatase [Novosphingobium aureum]
MASKKPNILILWGDDIGQHNLSCYSHGVMGYKTPNIDRIAKEGVLFTDYYAEQSCTAGRAAFIMGQAGMRTGMTKVGLPGADLGMRPEDPTIARMLKNQGYRTGQFGKNHLGDRDEHLPTMHGFDEFFGNLYHLNAEEEPELPDYPPASDFPDFKKNYGPRGVLHCWADGKGGQKIENTGPLTKKRMETADEEFLKEAKRFIKEAVDADEPFFVWFNTTHMHFRTHVKPEYKGKSGRWQSEYHDVMIYHDDCIGEMLDYIDELGVADNTFTMYSTDNGPHQNSWPDAGTTPFRSEKNTNWEGAYRVPCMVRWPGQIEAGSVCNGIVSHLDWFPTFANMAGAGDVKSTLKEGATFDGHKYKVHLDGWDLTGFLTGKTDKSPRPGFIYFNDDADVVALRYDNWKMVFLEQRCTGTMQIWAEPFVELRVPKIFNLKTDPYERADRTSNTYYDWLLDHTYLLVPAQSLIADFLGTFGEFPPRQKAASFSIDQVMEKMEKAQTAQR